MMDMQDSPYDFQPLHCQDCGRENAQLFRDREYDDGELIVCIDCVLERIAQYRKEEGLDDEEEEGDDD
jgi:hypothetical protein